MLYRRLRDRIDPFLLQFDQNWLANGQTDMSRDAGCHDFVRHSLKTHLRSSGGLQENFALAAIIEHFDDDA
jgi:hypothetical protein